MKEIGLETKKLGWNENIKRRMTRSRTTKKRRCEILWNFDKECYKVQIVQVWRELEKKWRKYEEMKIFREEWQEAEQQRREGVKFSKNFSQNISKLL